MKYILLALALALSACSSAGSVLPATAPSVSSAPLSARVHNATLPVLYTVDDVHIDNDALAAVFGEFPVGQCYLPTVINQWPNKPSKSFSSNGTCSEATISASFEPWVGYVTCIWTVDNGQVTVTRQGPDTDCRAVANNDGSWTLHYQSSGGSVVAFP